MIFFSEIVLIVGASHQSRQFFGIVNSDFAVIVNFFNFYLIFFF